MIKLEQRWKLLWDSLGISQRTAPSFEGLERYYNAQGRFYHVLNHIGNGLVELDFANRVGIVEYPKPLELVWWHHDYEYNSRKKDNEEKSWEKLSDELIKYGLFESIGDKCRIWTLDTKHIQTPKTNDGKIIVDIDLSIFGKSEEEFDEYEENIKK